MKAIIPTGGRGTRMRPITYSANKHFIPVANKPLILYPIETVANAGVKQIGITYNPGGLEEAQAVLGDGSKWGLAITYCLQEKPAGLANIVQVCEQFLAGDSFIFHLGDNIFVDGIKDLVDTFTQKSPNALLTMMQHKDNRRLGVPFFDEQGKFIKYVEKPDNPPNNFGIPGLYFFDKHVFEAFKGPDAIKPSERGELEVGSLYNWLINHKYLVEAMEYTGKWLDPGKFDDWISANQYILDTQLKLKLDTELDEDVWIENRVAVGKNCQINNSHLRGPIIIGDGVTIKDSYVGPFTAIGDGCELVEANIENSVVMEKVKIRGVKRSIDNSLIGKESEISSSNGPTSHTKLFIGEKCILEI